jgi:hypothetical protein
VTNQLPLPGPLKVLCPCGCGVFGTPKRKAWGDGLRHVKGCGPCRRCTGSRSKSRASRRENRVARDIGGTREPMSGALSGKDVTAGLWALEETANVALVRGIRRWWTSDQIRRKTARLMAQHGVAHGFVCSWDGRPQIVVMPYEDWVGQLRSGSLSRDAQEPQAG